MKNFDDYVGNLTDEETIALLHAVLAVAANDQAVLAAFKQWAEDNSMVDEIQAIWD